MTAGVERQRQPDLPDSELPENDLEVLVLRMVKNDPFSTISEMRREFKRLAAGETASWWQVFGTLRRHRLLRRRSRFRYAWGRG